MTNWREELKEYLLDICTHNEVKELESFIENLLEKQKEEIIDGIINTAFGLNPKEGE